jgi:DNA-binding PadR family transcriptional regulator
VTYSTAVVLAAIGNRLQYGFDIMEATGLPSGTVYPILRRLERTGLLRADWEDETAAHADQRPARRYYELTRRGATALDEARLRYRGLERLFAAPADGARDEARS